MQFTEKPVYGFEDLIEIVKILRAPDGCPWDREQTHKSIRANFIEETYEAIEAIDTEDTELLKEELIGFPLNRQHRIRVGEIFHCLGLIVLYCPREHLPEYLLPGRATRTLRTLTRRFQTGTR